MNIKIIDFGGRMPERAHFNDAGADVFTNERMVMRDQEVCKIKLGIGLELPDGFAAFVLPRSGRASNEGLLTGTVPIDSGYTGEIHAIIHNTNNKTIIIEKGEKIAQLVIVPVLIANFHTDEKKSRGDKGFGSTDI